MISVKSLWRSISLERACDVFITVERSIASVELVELVPEIDVSDEVLILSVCLP